MFRFILLAIGFSMALAQPDLDDMHKCKRLMHGGMACCKKDLPKLVPPSDDIKECFQMLRKPPSCEMEICIAKKKGIASADGTIDKKAFTADIENIFESDPDLAGSIIKNCVDGDISKYGKDDFCDLFKIKMCSNVQITKSCDEWDDAGDCNGMKELAAECIKRFD